MRCNALHLACQYVGPLRIGHRSSHLLLAESWNFSCLAHRLGSRPGCFILRSCAALWTFSEWWLELEEVCKLKSFLEPACGACSGHNTTRSAKIASLDGWTGGNSQRLLLCRWRTAALAKLAGYEAEILCFIADSTHAPIAHRDPSNYFYWTGL